MQARIQIYISIHFILNTSIKYKLEYTFMCSTSGYCACVRLEEVRPGVSKAPSLAVIVGGRRDAALPGPE